MKNNSQSTFHFKISNSKPILLDDFSKSLKSLSDEYDFFAKRDSLANPSRNKLYIRQITKGSIDIELVAMSALLLFEHFNTICEFSKHLKCVFDTLLLKNNCDLIDTKTLKNTIDILAPIAKDKNSSVQFAPNIINGDVTVNVFNNNEVVSITEHANQTIEQRAIEEEERKEKTHVLLYFEQASTKSKKQANKGVIESLSKKPLYITFGDDETLKSSILFSDENPLTKVYEVDVEIVSVDNKPYSYKIEKLHDVYDR